MTTDGSAQYRSYIPPTDAVVLAKAIRFAAVVIGVSMILLGLMVWQPWASPSYEEVQSTTANYEACVAYKDSVTCNW